MVQSVFLVQGLQDGFLHKKIRTKGGNTRAEKLSAERRKEIAHKAAKARWDKKRREEESS